MGGGWRVRGGGSLKDGWRGEVKNEWRVEG